MAETVYILCFLASAACAVLLLRAFARSRTRILMWGGLCFTGLAINNILLFVDLIVLPNVDLSIYRSLSALVAMLLLVFGLIWDAE